MKVTLKSTDKPLNYIGSNEAGQHINLSGSGEGVGPMQSVLLAAAGCSAIDIELILKKMRQDLQMLEVIVNGQRAEDQIPKVFTHIHLHYILYGSIKKSKAEDAVSKSVEKYCSVITMLMHSVEVKYSFEIK